jgi:rhodanese-related sulfurtransferase
MQLIAIEELKAKIDRKDEFKLVMVLGEWAFRAAHIPGSINVNRLDDAKKYLQKDDEIVVYCSDQNCIASQAAYRYLISAGYTNVRRFAGGLSAWSAAGYELEGEAT